MNWLIVSFTLLLLAALFSFFSRGEGAKKILGCGGVIVGSLIGLVPALEVLRKGSSLERTWPWGLPGLTFTLGIDPLSAFFLAVIFTLSAVAGIYALGYLKDQKQLLPSLPFFPLLVAAMAAVVTAQDGFLFLIFWELMSLASFFLVTAEHERREVRHAGWIYLVATHLATAFLMLLFVLLYERSGSFAFEGFRRIGLLSPSFAGGLFLFALIGFGTKAGIFPFHIWLPHAHPAAPSHISALMSGVMIKTGIYGILRTLTFLGDPPLWWGAVLIVLGILSAVLGVLYALMQHDLKRLLAYHSVENIGIIVIGIGLGLIGITLHRPFVTLLGFGGALFHVMNHAIFKGLLFLGAGSVLHGTHLRMIDQMGGLLKKMPVTGLTFFIAAAAICGLPPLNGFISEWLIYVGLFRGAQNFSHFPLFLTLAGILGIAFAGALAVACFTKVFGVCFLGEPRSRMPQEPREASGSMLFSMGILAFLCLAIGLFPQGVWPFLQSAVKEIGPNLAPLPLEETVENLAHVSRFFLIFLSSVILLSLLYRLFLRKKPVRRSLTWDCGYAFPSPRMQYTASSFAEPIGYFFRPLLKPQLHFKEPAGLFPTASRFEEHTEDLAERSLFKGLFEKTAAFFAWLRGRQKPRIQNYLGLIFVTLILLLLWEVWIGL